MSISAIPYDSRLPESVTGRRVVSEDKLERVLGETAFHLWQILCSHRNKQGLTTITYAGIQRAKSFSWLSTKQIERGMDRLRKSGLVVDLYCRRQRMMRPSRKAGCQVEVWAMPRVIKGARAAGLLGNGNVVMVPAQTMRWVDHAPSWGGKRRRPSKSTNPTKVEITVARVQKRIRAAISRYWEGLDLPRTGRAFPDYQGIVKHLGPCPGKRNRYHIGYEKPLSGFNLLEYDQWLKAFAPQNHTWIPAKRGAGLDGNGNSLGPPKQTGTVQVGVYRRDSSGGTDLLLPNIPSSNLISDVGRFASQICQHGLADASPHDSSSEEQPDPPLLHVPNNLDETSDPGLGTRLGGTVRRLPPPPPGKHGIPHKPTANRTPPAMVPRPPQLPDEDEISDTEAARWLLKSYRGAMTSRYKKRCWVLAGSGKLEKSKYLPKLVEAAHELRDMGIPPASWAAWSIDCWRKYRIGKGKPRITWVFSLKRMEDHLSWFRSEEGHYSARRAIFPQPAQLLMYRFEQMQNDLARTGAQGRKEVGEVVHKWFPDDLYEELVLAARKRALDDQIRINRCVSRGDWVWG